MPFPLEEVERSPKLSPGAKLRECSDCTRPKRNASSGFAKFEGARKRRRPRRCFAMGLPSDARVQNPRHPRAAFTLRQLSIRCASPAAIKSLRS